jgi:hypothetical protein
MSAATNTPGSSLKELGSMDKAKEKINEYYEYCRGIFFIGKTEKLEIAEIYRFFDIKEDNQNLDIFFIYKGSSSILFSKKHCTNCHRVCQSTETNALDKFAAKLILHDCFQPSLKISHILFFPNL